MFFISTYRWGFPGGASGKEPTCQYRRCEMRVRSLVGKIPWTRAWQPTPVFLPGESPWTEEPGGLQSIESQRVGHDWSKLAHIASNTSKKKKKSFLVYFNVRGGQDRNDDPRVASGKVEAYRVKRLVGIQQAGQGQPSTWLGSLFSVHSILGVHQEARCPRVESWKPARETGCQDSNLFWSGHLHAVWDPCGFYNPCRWWPKTAMVSSAKWRACQTHPRSSLGLKGVPMFKLLLHTERTNIRMPREEGRVGWIGRLEFAYRHYWYYVQNG